MAKRKNAPRRELTQERVRELFDYREDGNLIRRNVPGKGRQLGLVGKVAGSKRRNGGFEVGIDGKNHLLHRVIFLWHHGYLPDEVDHKDRIRSHNWIDNLRDATHQDNMYNLSKPAQNTSGFKGVAWSNVAKRWRSQIRVEGRQKHLGYFDTREEAHAAYCEAGKRFHGDFFNAG